MTWRMKLETLLIRWEINRIRRWLIVLFREFEKQQKKGKI